MSSAISVMFNFICCYVFVYVLQSLFQGLLCN